MKEHPILFSGPMIRALLAGTKTQTRRIVTPQPPARTTLVDWNTAESAFVPWNWSSGAGSYTGGNRTGEPFACPYGGPGDRLWVRETWNVKGLAWRMKPCDAAKIASADAWQYAATDAEKWQHGWRPGIHMPRAASRITLEIVSVRVERLQSITEDDAHAEGVQVPPGGYVDGGNSALAFAGLWDAINGKRASWASNPWVWRIEFPRLTPCA